MLFQGKVLRVFMASHHQRRVVITGLGVASSYPEEGDSLEAFKKNIFSGKSSVRSLEGVVDLSDLPTRFGAFVQESPDWTSLIDRKMYRKYDRSTKYAIIAAKKALADSCLAKDAVNPLRAGVLIATGLGGMQAFYEGVLRMEEKGAHFVNPYFVSLILTHTPGDAVALDFGWNGVNYSVSTACASSNYMMMNALRHIQRGDADVIAVGGTEAAVNRIALVGFTACRALSTYKGDPKEASRPFDLARDGFVIGEGAGVLIFEELGHALARGAKIYAEVAGAATTTDAYHLTNPREDGLMVAECMKLALEDSSERKEDVDLIKAHATSTLAGDRAEVRAMNLLFGELLVKNRVPVLAPKSLFGHALGAAAALEAVAVALCFEKNRLFPTINLQNPDPEVEGLWVPTEETDYVPHLALLNSFGFGGHNSTIVFRKYAESL